MEQRGGSVFKVVFDVEIERVGSTWSLIVAGVHDWGDPSSLLLRVVGDVLRKEESEYHQWNTYSLQHN